MTNATIAHAISTAGDGRWSFDGWLQREATHAERHELLQGQLYARACPSRAHATVMLNLSAALHMAVRGSGRRVHANGLAVHIPDAEAALFPDLLITADPRDHAAERYLQYPLLIIEVLSPQTAAFDAGAKFAAYRRLPTLCELLLVDPEGQRIDHFCRAKGGSWIVVESPEDLPVRFLSIGATVEWGRVFEDCAVAQRPADALDGTAATQSSGFAPEEVDGLNESAPLSLQHRRAARLSDDLAERAVAALADGSLDAEAVTGRTLPPVSIDPDLLAALPAAAQPAAQLPPAMPAEAGPFLVPDLRSRELAEPMIFPKFSVPDRARPITLPNLERIRERR